jgi:hypothetical protein
MRRTLMAGCAAPAVALVLPLTGGCGVLDELTTRTMSGEEVATEVNSQLEDMPGIAEGEVTCPDLVDEVGNEVRCTRVVEADGVRVVIGLGVEVVEPGEDGNNLAFQVDDEPESVTVLADTLEEFLAGQLEQQTGRAADEVTCPPLPGEEGTAVTCELTDQGEPLEVEITATRVRGTEVSFEISRVVE